MSAPQRALSISPFAAALLEGPAVLGMALSPGYALFGQQVVALTPPGALRMPNGIESDLTFSQGEPVYAGAGVLRASGGIVMPGPVWCPRPAPRFVLSVSPQPKLPLESLVGRGPGLTPLGDDLIAGYLAGLALARMAPCVAAAWAELAARRTTALSGTLLRLAAQGFLPEAAHRLLEQGDPAPLLAFGASSGKGIALGLAVAGAAARGSGRRRVVALTIPFGEPPLRFELAISLLEEGVPC